jgi:hypothetical protein
MFDKNPIKDVMEEVGIDVSGDGLLVDQDLKIPITIGQKALLYDEEQSFRAEYVAVNPTTDVFNPWYNISHAKGIFMYYFGVKLKALDDIHVELIYDIGTPKTRDVEPEIPMKGLSVMYCHIDMAGNLLQDYVKLESQFYMSETLRHLDVIGRYGGKNIAYYKDIDAQTCMMITEYMNTVRR